MTNWLQPLFLTALVLTYLISSIVDKVDMLLHQLGLVNDNVLRQSTTA